MNEETRIVMKKATVYVVQCGYMKRRYLTKRGACLRLALNKINACYQYDDKSGYYRDLDIDKMVRRLTRHYMKAITPAPEEHHG